MVLLRNCQLKLGELQWDCLFQSSHSFLLVFLPSKHHQIMCKLMKNPKWNGYNYSIWRVLLGTPKGFLYIMTSNVRGSDLLYFTAWREHRTCKITTFIIRQNTLSPVITVFWYFQCNLNFFLINFCYKEVPPGRCKQIGEGPLAFTFKHVPYQ